MTEKDLSPPVESKPVEATTQPDQQTGEGEADKTTSPSIVQPADPQTNETNSTESKEETDRNQDESIALIADQTKWIAKQTAWARNQTIASGILGIVTLGVLVYHGWIMRRQSQAMSEQTTVMKGQLASMTSGSAQTDKMLTAMQEQAKAATAQAGTSRSLTEAEQRPG